MSKATWIQSERLCKSTASWSGVLDLSGKGGKAREMWKLSSSDLLFSPSTISKTTRELLFAPFAPSLTLAPARVRIYKRNLEQTNANHFSLWATHRSTRKAFVWRARLRGALAVLERGWRTLEERRGEYRMKCTLRLGMRWSWIRCRLKTIGNGTYHFISFKWWFRFTSRNIETEKKNETKREIANLRDAREQRKYLKVVLYDFSYQLLSNTFITSNFVMKIIFFW